MFQVELHYRANQQYNIKEYNRLSDKTTKIFSYWIVKAFKEMSIGGDFIIGTIESNSVHYHQYE